MNGFISLTVIALQDCFAAFSPAWNLTRVKYWRLITESLDISSDERAKLSSAEGFHSHPSRDEMKRVTNTHHPIDTSDSQPPKPTLSLFPTVFSNPGACYSYCWMQELALVVGDRLLSMSLPEAMYLLPRQGEANEASDCQRSNGGALTHGS